MSKSNPRWFLNPSPTFPKKHKGKKRTYGLAYTWQRRRKLPTSKKIKRSTFKCDYEFINALNMAGQEKKAEAYCKRKRAGRLRFPLVEEMAAISLLQERTRK